MRFLLPGCLTVRRRRTRATVRLTHREATEQSALVQQSSGCESRIPQTNGICVRLNKTVLTEFYQVALRKKIYRSIEELQADLDAWVRDYNTLRTHQGRWCYGKTPIKTFVDTLPVAKERLL
jgi:hypothetical protein